MQLAGRAHWPAGRKPPNQNSLALFHTLSPNPKLSRTCLLAALLSCHGPLCHHHHIAVAVPSHCPNRGASRESQHTPGSSAGPLARGQRTPGGAGRGPPPLPTTTTTITASRLLWGRVHTAGTSSIPGVREAQAGPLPAAAGEQQQGCSYSGCSCHPAHGRCQDNTQAAAPVGAFSLGGGQVGSGVETGRGCNLARGKGGEGSCPVRPAAISWKI